MKRKTYLLAGLAAMSLVSCNDWLTEEQPNQQSLKDFFTSGEAAVQTVTGCYSPLLWDFDGVYYNEWLVGDIVSDDAIKGGEYLGDMADVYDMENFKTVSTNTMLLKYYRTQYMGISRCNLALEYIPSMQLDEEMDADLQKRLIAEARFLRAFYYFRLVRLFGGVPMPTDPVTSSERWKMPRESAETVYALIIDDLAKAEADLPERSQYTVDDLGRATKGAAQAMLMKVNLYLKNYDKVLEWGKKIIPQDGSAGEYSLCPDYFSQFRISGEFSEESVFEIQAVKDIYSDFSGDGQEFGTFTPIMTRPRSPKVGGAAGWGFNRPSRDLYLEFESTEAGDKKDDPRREWTIITMADDEITNANEDIHYNNRYYSRKYLYESDQPSSSAGYRFVFLELDGATPNRCPLNRKEIRYADVLLMYAEAAIESNTETGKALEYINLIRGRVGLDPVPAATREALRHERRCELAMEGHRWFDLIRWGAAGEVMRAYRAKYSTAAKSEYTEGDPMADFVDGKHELMPIPQEEVRLGSLSQNPGY